MTVAEWMEEITESRSPRGYGGRFYGAYPALVSDIKDPDGQGRVKISLPWSPDTGSASYEAWARVATMMGGNNRGTWFIPDVNDEVLVTFLGGDSRNPCVIGGLWNGQDQPPQSMDGAGKNYIKKVRSRNGVQITLDDTDGQEKMILETPGGQKITLQDGPGSISLEDSTAEISAGMLTVNAGMSTFSGVVQDDTVITNSVISASYTPGAGNIW